LNIKYSFFWLLLSGILFASSFYGFSDEDNPLSASSGVLESYSFGRGGDFSVLVRLADGGYKSFDFLQFRSYLLGELGGHKGRKIRIEHYGGVIANCWDGVEQFCFSKCRGDRECRLAQNRNSAIWLRAGAALIFAFLIVIFFFHLKKMR